MTAEKIKTPNSDNKFCSRIKLIDYTSPETEICACEYALLFGSRHAQAELVANALALFHSGQYETLIITGGKTRCKNISEASEIADRLISAGLNKTRIILEEESSNTGENVTNTRNLMNQCGLRELLLIGKIYAKRRYVMTIKKQWPEIERVSCAAVNYFGVDRAQWWKSACLRSRILEEMRKIEAYLKKGDLSEIEIVDRRFRL